VTHMLELVDTPTEFEVAQLLTSLVSHRVGSRRNSPLHHSPENPKIDDQELAQLTTSFTSHRVGSCKNSPLPHQHENPKIEDYELTQLLTSFASHRVDSRNHSPVKECDLDELLTSLSSLTGSSSNESLLNDEQKEARNKAQELISFLTHDPAYIEYESDSDSGCEDPDDNVITAFLHIPLYSPVKIRTEIDISKPAKEKVIHPLSPLSQLSQKLTQRLAVHKDSLEASFMKETATQTSVCSSTSTLLLSPSPSRLQESPSSETSSNLPSLSPCHRLPVLTTASEYSSETPFSIESSSSGQTDEAAPKDSLQDIIFDKEETEKVRQQEQDKENAEGNIEEECSPCMQCKEKQKGKHSVRFNLTVGEETRTRKKKSIFETFIHCLIKLSQKFKSKCFC